MLLSTAARARFFPAIVCLVCVGCASGGQPAAPGTANAPLRGAHTIAVPFVSFAEAKELDFRDKDILNPSFAAAMAMVLRYGGQDLSLLTKSNGALPDRGGWAVMTQKNGGNLDALKRFIDRDVPVIVTPTWTSVAHPADPVLEMLAMIKKVDVRPTLPTSGALLPMRPLADFVTLKRALGENFHWESLLLHGRVIIGYDDARGVIVMHDPLFGPALEMSYAEFELMWAPADNWFIAVEPRTRPQPSSDTTYRRPRTAGEIGAERFVRGYALEAVGKNELAAGVLRNALTIEGLPPEMKYLMLNELGYVARNLGNETEALQFADQASAIAPESPAPWRLRLDIAKSSKAPDAAGRLSLAESTLRRLCTDQPALQALNQSLLAYIQIWSIGCQ